ncbi:hypothetical protein E2C01_056122 [Portunus trituberculatus]|uniref:Uncharacterized protein n=1 Tax=Portunus trituberculatus TaxID=210409 RepID=A0A5B7GT83_PORTR|nr:hypothetical protein [Portunus trituberculatus]
MNEIARESQREKKYRLFTQLKSSTQQTRCLAPTAAIHSVLGLCMAVRVVYGEICGVCQVSLHRHGVPLDKEELGLPMDSSI